MLEIRPNFIAIPREREVWENPIYVKSLALVTPEVASRDYGLTVDSPVLTSNFGTVVETPLTCKFRIGVDTPLVWQKAGQLLEAPTFSPSQAVGIAFKVYPVVFLTNGSSSSHDVQLQSWAAIIDPVGRVWTDDEERIVGYRYARAARIKELNAYCYGCLDVELAAGIPIRGPNARRRVIDDPLQEGLAVDVNSGRLGQGELLAICGLEKHPELTALVIYTFRMSPEEGLVLTDPPK